ncbi:MAG TPA: ABC transporter substrate-binding protein [Actinomycetota bacterium]|nr:ABC transporter substrate-binding protein [Actinomycetota bacterium]
MREALTIVAAALLVAGCAPEEQATTGGGGTQPDSCATDQLPVVQEGRLTIGTDNPAFPPWFGGGTPEGSPWEINDPSTGKGFESAVAYAAAEELGFSEGEVEWVEVPFNQSFKPGPKDFDFDINQISYVPERDEAVDFSESYYDVNQALVAVGGTPIADATSLEDLRQYKLGAQVGTTSFSYIEDNIQPDQDPAVYDTNNDAIRALENGQIDGLVVDLPTAFFVTAVQIPNGVIVGQFPTIGQQEYFGMVFEDGNPLVECVNQALDRLKEDGTLQAIQQRWLADKADAPVLE